MTYDYFEFDGYIELDRKEMARLKNGEKFVTVIRPAANNISKYGAPGVTLGATETNSMRPQFNLKMVSSFFTNGEWIMVFARLKNAM
jgi:hypothetical protein